MHSGAAVNGHRRPGDKAGFPRGWKWNGSRDLINSACPTHWDPTDGSGSQLIVKLRL